MRLAGRLAAVLWVLAVGSAAFADDSVDRPQSLRITAVQLNPGGFQPCPDSALALGMPVGQRNPDAAYLKCVTAHVTIGVVAGAGGGYPTLHATLEGWGFALLAGGTRYDGRSPPQLYDEYYDVGTTGAPGARSWTLNAVAVTYYDGKLDWPAQSQGSSLTGAGPPAAIRDHLLSPGAEIEFSIQGTDAPRVQCRYLRPTPPAPDRLLCDGLPHGIDARPALGHPDRPAGLH